MEVLVLLVFISMVLVAGAVAFFAWNVRQGTHEHADRLALLPLRDDLPAGGTRPASGADDDARREGPSPSAPEPPRGHTKP